MMKILLMLALALVCLTPLAAQPPDTTPAKKAEMKKLDKMVGEWKGSGWMQRGPQKETFAGTESVQRKLDGLAVLVEGNFSNAEGKVVHQTLAVLSPNAKLSGYDFATYLANGITGQQQFRIVDDHFEWGFDVPGGTVRYTIKVDDKTWFEIGEFSRDGGKTWLKNFEMKLDRIKP